MKPKTRSYLWTILAGIAVSSLLGFQIVQDLRLRRSVEKLSGRVEDLENKAPRLGEYMTTLQFHMGKLWFAAKAENWDLALYEVDKLKETLADAQQLHAVVNTMDTSTNLGSLSLNQAHPMTRALLAHDLPAFRKYYGETLRSCNQCHEMTAHGSNVITVPTSPPVFNQLFQIKK